MYWMWFNQEMFSFKNTSKNLTEETRLMEEWNGMNDIKLEVKLNVISEMVFEESDVKRVKSVKHWHGW